MNYSEKTIELGDKIANLNLKQAKELSDYLEQVYGIKPASGTPVVVPQQQQQESKPVVEKTEFDVLLKSFGDKKVAIIKIVRQNTGLGLKEAKDLVEKAPVKIKEALSKADAEKLKAELEAEGGVVSVE